MATTYTHVQLSVVDKDGNVNVLYPQTYGADIKLVNNNKMIPSSVSDVQGLVDKMGAMAFDSGNNVLYYEVQTVADNDVPIDVSDGYLPESEINDSKTSTLFTWSSSKITKSTVTYLPAYAVTTDVLTTLYPYPLMFNVDSSVSNLRTLTPAPSDTDTLWVVEYHPYVSKSTDTKATRAYQLWRGINYGTGSVVEYVKRYSGEWGSYTKLH